MIRGNLRLVTLLFAVAACGKVNNFTDANQGDQCDDGNPCTVDSPDGNGGCNHDAGNAGTVCRAGVGDCDAEEVCDGASKDCPDDVFADATTVCRASTGTCDPAETCAGDSADCPADAVFTYKLYAAAGSGAAGNLYIINPATAGIVTDFGSTGVSITGMAMDPTNQTLYAVTGGQTALLNPSTLVTLDPTTGQPTVVGTLGVGSGGKGGNEIAADITFDTDGTLYAWLENSNLGSDDLGTVDLATGTATAIADSTLSTAGSGMTLDATGRVIYDNQTTLLVLDKATGLSTATIGTVTVTGGAAAGFINGMATDPTTGTIYGSMKGVGGGGTALFGPGSGTGTGGGGGNGHGRHAGLVGTASSLVTVDTSNAVVTVVGALPNDIDALAFACIAP
jgi:hypothetical protein